MKIHHSHTDKAVLLSEIAFPAFSHAIFLESMFTGDISGRKVNLGGASKQKDRASLIENQRRERQERDAARRRESACMKIQRVVRGRVVRRRLVDSMARAFYSRFEELRSKLVRKEEIGGLSFEGAWNPISFLSFLPPGKVDPQCIGELCGWYIQNGSYLSLTEENVLRLRNLVRHAIVYDEISGNVSEMVQHLPLMGRVIESERIDKVLLYKAIPNRLTYSIIRSKASSIKFVVPALVAGVDLLPVVDVFDSLPPLGETCACELTAVPLAELWMKAPQKGALDQWLVFSANESAELIQGKVQSILMTGMSAWMSRSLRVLLCLIDFESIPEDQAFGIAARSNFLQVLADNLISRNFSFPPDDELRRTVAAFTALYSRIVGAAFQAALRSETIEVLFPKLNKYVFHEIVAGSKENLTSSQLVQLVRSVHSKKHLYPNLHSDSNWVIHSSVTYIPVALNSYEIIDRLERDGSADDDFSSRKPESVFDRLVEEIPHVIPFEHRLRIFASTLAEDHLRHRQTMFSFRSQWNDHLRRVRRDHLFEDGLEVIEQAGRDLVRIEFVSKDGTLESGIDGGGLFKEFMQQWTLAAMNPSDELSSIFRQLQNGRLSPGKTSGSEKLYRACGKAVGKALYEMVLLETHFGESFLSRVLGKPFSLEHLGELDETLFQNLKFVTECENVEDLSLTFSVSCSHNQEVDLIPDGRNITVTKSNSLRYVLLASWFHLSRELDRPAAAFAAGLAEILPLSWLRMFSPSEINLLISGEQRKGFSVEDLRNNVVFGGGYSDSSETIQDLWNLLSEFSDQDRSAFLSFVTSAPRPPLLGFRVLHPKFGVNRVPEPDRLPTSSTCTNLLKLPDYRDKHVLRKKLLAAIYSQSGFDLS